jgi:hypothetical protein
VRAPLCLLRAEWLHVVVSGGARTDGTHKDIFGVDFLLRRSQTKLDCQQERA